MGNVQRARSSWRHSLVILDELRHPEASVIRSRLGYALAGARTGRAGPGTGPDDQPVTLVTGPVGSAIATICAVSAGWAVSACWSGPAVCTLAVVSAGAGSDAGACYLRAAEPAAAERGT